MNTASHKQRNCSLDIFRIVFAILVVLLHTKPDNFADQYPLADSIIFSLPKLSVPFFFAVSGYFFFKSKNSTATARHQIKKIIIIYLVWTCLYAAIKFFQWGYSSPVGFLVDCVYSFVISGSYYHLWYFPALIFSILVSTCFLKFRLKKLLYICSILLYSVLCLIDTFRFPNIALLSTLTSTILPLSSGLLFFCSGQVLNVIIEKYSEKLNSKLMIGTLFALLAVWLGLVLANDFLKLSIDLIIIYGIYITIGLILLILLCNPLYQYSSLSKKCRFLANFIYFAHPMFHFILEVIGKNILSFSSYLSFPLTLALTLTCGWILYKLNNAKINAFIA